MKPKLNCLTVHFLQWPLKAGPRSEPIFIDFHVKNAKNKLYSRTKTCLQPGTKKDTHFKRVYDLFTQKVATLKEVRQGTQRKGTSSNQNIRVVLISHRVLLSTNVACSLNQLFLKHGNILLQKQRQINRTVTEDGATSARNVKLFFKSKKNPQFQTS